MDHESFARGWTKAQPVVANYVAACVPDLHAAEDLLQDIAVVILQSEYDPQYPFANWALGIARNRILNYWRQSGRGTVNFSPEVAEMLAAVSSEMAPELEERTAALRRCMEKIQGRAWKLIELRYEHVLTVEQIGRKLEMNSGAVRMALRRVRQLLQNCVERQLAAVKGDVG